MNPTVFFEKGKWFLVNLPEESSFYIGQGSEDGYFDQPSYEQAVELAKQSAIEFKEEFFEKIKRLCWNPIEGKFYQLEGVEIRIKQKCQHKGIHNSTCEYRKVAILVDDKPPVEVKKDSKDEAKEKLLLRLKIMDTLFEFVNRGDSKMTIHRKEFDEFTNLLWNNLELSAPSRKEEKETDPDLVIHQGQTILRLSNENLTLKQRIKQLESSAGEKKL